MYVPRVCSPKFDNIRLKIKRLDMIKHVNPFSQKKVMSEVSCYTQAISARHICLPCKNVNKDKCKQTILFDTACSLNVKREKPINILAIHVQYTYKHICILIMVKMPRYLWKTYLYANVFMFGCVRV